MKKQVIRHLKHDVSESKESIKEDKALMKKLSSKKKHVKKVAHKKKSSKKPVKGKAKIEKVLHEFKTGTLHSGSKRGPKVKSRKQAIAIALSEQRKANK